MVMVRASLMHSVTLRVGGTSEASVVASAGGDEEGVDGGMDLAVCSEVRVRGGTAKAGARTRVWPKKHFNPCKTTTLQHVAKHANKDNWKVMTPSECLDMAENDKKFIEEEARQTIHEFLLTAGMACGITYQPPGGDTPEVATNQTTMGIAWKQAPESDRHRMISRLVWALDHAPTQAMCGLCGETLAVMFEQHMMGKMGVQHKKEDPSVAPKEWVAGCVARSFVQQLSKIRGNVFKRSDSTHDTRVAFRDPFETERAKAEKKESNEETKSKKEPTVYIKSTERIEGTMLFPHRKITRKAGECCVGVKAAEEKAHVWFRVSGRWLSTRGTMVTNCDNFTAKSALKIQSSRGIQILAQSLMQFCAVFVTWILF